MNDMQQAPHGEPTKNPFQAGDVVDWCEPTCPVNADAIAKWREMYGAGPYMAFPTDYVPSFGWVGAGERPYVQLIPTSLPPLDAPVPSFGYAWFRLVSRKA